MPVARLAALALVLAACVVQDPSKVMCYEDSDCHGHEVCGDDHICYGDPPKTAFEAELTPPLDRPDLAPCEQSFMATEQGDFVLEFAPTIEVSGRVVLTADPTTTVPAHLVFRRPSRIKGAPDYVVATDSIPDSANPDAASFSLRLVPTMPGETFTVTIYPDDTPNPDNVPTLAQKVPPYRQIGFAFEADAPGIVFPLGGESPTGLQKRITGRVIDSTLHPQTDFEVRAYGKFGPLDPVEVASSRDDTAGDGRFSIVVPAAWEDDFDVRITPRPGTAQPSILLKQVHIDDATAEKNLGDIVLPTYPAITPYWVPVSGQAPEGGLEPAVGARITLRTVLFEDVTRVITYEAQGAADEDGLAEVPLIPATAGQNRMYSYDVAPVANTPHRSIWGQTLEVGPTGGVLASGAILGPRVLLSGQVLDSLGLPLASVNVQVVPSVRLVAELELKSFDLSTVQFPSTASAGDGRFSVWVDPEILSIQAGYLVDFDPPADSLQPRWTLSDETRILGGDGQSQTLGEIWLPDPAYVRGTLTTAANEPVPGAEVRLYEVVNDLTACPDANPCQPPALLRAQGTTSEKGGVRLVLPRP
jgi:hypothetical protein